MTTYIFCHQVKSGGTSLQSYLRRAFGLRHSHTANADPYYQLMEDPYAYLDVLIDVERLSFIHGHIWMPPGWEDDDRIRVISVIRHPVDRLVSWFYYMRGKNARQFRPVPKDLTIEEFARDIDRFWPQLKTDQIRRLSPTLNMDAIRYALDDGKLISCATGQLDKLPHLLRVEIPAADTEFTHINDAFTLSMPKDNVGSYEGPSGEVLKVLESHLTREMELYYMVCNHFTERFLEIKVQNEIE